MSVEEKRERDQALLASQIKKSERAKQDKEAAALEIASQKKSIKAAKIGTEIGGENKNLADVLVTLNKYLRDANRVNTSRAKQIKTAQEFQNKKLAEIIPKLEESPSKYEITDKTTGEKRRLVGKDIMELKNALKEGKENLQNINQAIQKGETNKELYAQYIRTLEEKSLEPQLKKTYTYKTSPKKTGKDYPEADPNTASRIAKRVNFVQELLNEDIKDKNIAEEVLRQVTPLYVQTETTKGANAGDRFVARYEKKLRDYEALADYQTPIGIEDLNPKNINKIKARLAHASMSTAKGFITTIPVAGLAAAGGPAVGGLIAAASIATALNPDNREIMKEYIEAHPQEFLFALGGSLLAGVTVTEANRAFREYTKNLKIAERRKLEAKWDKLIDDYAYLEQQSQRAGGRPVEFPSRALEIPEPYGNQVIISDPINPEQVIFENMMRAGVEIDPLEVLSVINKWKRDYGESFYYDAGGGLLEPTSSLELINKHPELLDPYFNPAFRDPNILNKADIVARSNNPKVNYLPLYAAALSIISKQGYITEEQINELIKDNNIILTELRENNIEIPDSYDITDISSLSIPEIADIVKQEQEPISTVALIPIMDIIETPIIPEPEPIEPITPSIKLPKSKERRELNLRLFKGKKQRYRVRFTYSDKTKQTVTVSARSYPEAIDKAEMSKRHGKVVDMTYAEIVG